MRGSKHVLRRVAHPRLRRGRGSRSRIVRHADVWGGKAVIAGTRVPAFMVQARLQSGWPVQEIRAAYPALTDADIEAVTRYARVFPERLAEDRLAYERSLPPGGGR